MYAHDKEKEYCMLCHLRVRKVHMAELRVGLQIGTWAIGAVGS